MRINLPEVYSQFDTRWSKTLLGNNTEPVYNFNNYGCLVSSLASICRYYGKQISPIELNQRLIEVGGFTPGSGEYVNGAITKIFPDITEVSFPTPQPLSNDQLNEIRGSIDGRHPVIVGIDYNPKTIKAESHFSILVDYDPSDESNFTLADSLGGRIHSLKDYLAWFKPDARHSIEKYFIYRGTVPQMASPVAPEPSGQPVAPIPPPVPAEPVQPASNATTGGLPANYSAIVHGSTQWDNVVPYLELAKPANSATFEDAKKVVAGFKSRATDLDRQRQKAEDSVAQLSATVKNQTEKIGTLEKEVSRTLALWKAEVDSLKQNTPNFDKLQKQYEVVYRDVKTDLDNAVSELETLRIDKAVAQGLAGDSVSEVPTGFSVFREVVTTVKRFVVKKW